MMITFLDHVQVSSDSSQFIFKLNPFELDWDKTNLDSEISDILGVFGEAELTKQRQGFPFETINFTDKEIEHELQEFFSVKPNNRWHRVLRPLENYVVYLSTAVAFEKTEEGTVISIVLRLEEIPTEDNDMKELQRMSYDYYQSIYKDKLSRLTKTECLIFEELVKGKTTTQIASERYRSKFTIESHSASIKEKLECKNILELMRLGFLIGI